MADNAGEMLGAVLDVVEGRPSRRPGERLDALLRWLSEQEAPDSGEVRRELARRGIEPSWVRRMALMHLEETLFARLDASPESLLGLGPNPSPVEVRDRYHTLMRVYHPDRGEGRPEWLHERSTRLNDAYRRARSAVPEPTPAPEPVVAPLRSLERTTRARRKSDRRRLRRALGTPRTLRSRALAGLAAVGAAAVLYTFVAHRAWERWQAPPASVSQIREARQ